MRVVNQRGPIADHGSGTLAAGDGKTALVITCRHIFDEGRGVLTVERTNHQRYPAKLLGVSRNNDVAALEIPDPGVRTLRIAERQAPAATLIGWGGTTRAWKHRGDLIETARDTVFYSFVPLEGDSGGGVFDDAGALTGVVWGTSGKSGAVVPLNDLRAALDSPACSRYWKTASTTKEATPMIATPLLLAAMIAQSPGLPSKGQPLSVAPSPQGQTFAPQSLAPQVYDVPITVRVHIRPEIQTYAPQPQTFAAPQVFSGGCYGGSYSGGFSAQYQSYAAPAVMGCPGGFCGAVRNHVKIKNKVQASGRGGGLLGLNWFARQ